MNAIIMTLTLLFAISTCAQATVEPTPADTNQVTTPTPTPDTTPSPQAPHSGPQEPASNCPGNSTVTPDDTTTDVPSEGGGPTAQGS